MIEYADNFSLENNLNFPTLLLDGYTSLLLLNMIIL